MKVIYDASGGIVRYVHQDEDTWTFGIYQDAEPVLEHNRALRDLPNNGLFRRKASIPCGLLMQWLKEDGIEAHAYHQWPWREQQKYLNRRLDSSDYQNLRTA